MGFLFVAIVVLVGLRIVAQEQRKLARQVDSLRMQQEELPRRLPAPTPEDAAPPTD